MILPTDQTRKTNEIVKTAEIVGIRTSNGYIEVQCEFEDQVKTAWMPYCLPFVGGTSIFCYPKIGQGGLILSEGGEHRINRFLPILDTSKQFSGLGSSDFKILFENGDFIHHRKGSLHIKSQSKVKVESNRVEITAKDIETKGNNFTVNADLIRLNGYVQVAGGFAQVNGGARSNYRATFASPTTFVSPLTANVDIKINGISFVKHQHDTPKGMSDIPQ